TFLPASSFGQTLCDSITIDCCYFDSTGHIRLNSGNTSSDIVDYPGFLILDANGDTVAMEVVNYFGIGSGPQSHWMEIKMAFALPMTGTLELHRGFYASRVCSWPLTIEDTLITAIDPIRDETEVLLYPNPSLGNVVIRRPQSLQNGTWNVQLRDLQGRLLENLRSHQPFLHLVRPNLPTGTYFLEFRDENGSHLATRKWFNAQ
ncbi:MAG: T9SS type A sorting domain-containing protein, partial [Bacteroidota bacterium]